MEAESPLELNVHQQQPGIKTFAFYAGPKIPEGLVVIL